MEFQERNYTCGPAAVRAALYFLGHNVQEATVRKWAKTTPKDGTDEKGILRALNHYGHKGVEYQSPASRKSFQWLKENISKGHPVLLCVDSWNHWVSAVGLFGSEVIIFDPNKPAGKQRKYSGLKTYKRQDLLARWGCYDEKKIQYYGISVHP